MFIVRRLILMLHLMLLATVGLPVCRGPEFSICPGRRLDPPGGTGLPAAPRPTPYQAYCAGASPGLSQGGYHYW